MTGSTQKSFLRWAGSKQKLLPTLKEYWNSSEQRYVEPFMGSAQLFFAIEPKEALLSDLNFDLIEVFNHVRKNPYPVYEFIKNLEISEIKYYELRAIDPSTLSIVERAGRFTYLNRLCFNGLYRTNLKGQFNVPFGKKCPKQICDYEFLERISAKLSSATIVHGDFEKVLMDNVRPNDFVYLDPPYAVGNRRIFRQYGPQTFGLDDLQRLKKVIQHIESKNATFLLSYAYCKEALDLFSDWTVRKTFTQRNISGFAKFRRKAAELLVTNVILNE